MKLIRLPGLSSKETVTEVSGRGMGMGAVADACEALGGTGEVKSQWRVGSESYALATQELHQRELKRIPAPGVRTLGEPERRSEPFTVSAAVGLGADGMQ